MRRTKRHKTQVEETEQASETESYVAGMLDLLHCEFKTIMISISAKDSKKKSKQHTKKDGKCKQRNEHSNKEF